MLQYYYRKHFYKQRCGNDCNTTVCVITQPLIIKNDLNTVALPRILGYFIDIFSGNKNNYLYYFNNSINDWYFLIKNAFFRLGEKRIETVGRNGDTMIWIYCIQSISQGGKFLTGKAAPDVKIKEKQKSKPESQVFLSDSNMI